MFWNFWDLVWIVIGVWLMDKMFVIVIVLFVFVIMFDLIFKIIVICV